jgi:ATP-binding cassette subfamily F protein 3
MKQLERQFRHEEELLVLEAEAIRDREVAQRDASGGVQRKLASIKKRQEPRPIDTIVTGLYTGLYVPEKLCRAEAVSKGYGGEQLFRDLSFEIHRGDRVAVIGSNGSGKSTLLRVLTGKEQPDAGRVVWERGVTFVDFNEVMRELDDDDSVTHAVNVTKLAFLAPRKQVNRFLALLRFAEGDLTRRIGELSGGQRARVALAGALLSGAAVLVLDEPTNHLDVASIQVMERALVHFPGAVVVVSHDRFFIDKVATRLLVFDGDGRTREISGNWTTWQAGGGRATEEA